MLETVEGVPQVVEFTYDSVGRLSTVTRNSTLTASYTYDPNGNRATKVTSGGTLTAMVDDQDRLVSYGDATYSYSNHGDLERRIVGADTTEYTYDALGNLTQVLLPGGTEIGYLIDAQNRRIVKTVNDTLVRAWLYQGQLTPVAELDGAGTVVSRFVYATGVNVPDYLVRNDSTYRLIRDHLGSVRLVVNVATGNVVQRIDYDEFGIESSNTNPGWQPFGYAGGLTDSQTQLIRFGARDYDPTVGRWTAKDPIGFAGGATSLYTYAYNDPVNFVDASGQVPVLVVFLLKATIGGAISGAIESIALQLLLNGCIDWGQVGVDAVIGAAGGAISGALSVWNAARKATRLLNSLGDLTPSEIRQIQNVVDDAGRPLEVVGSATQGARRGPGTNLPIGKGPGTRSDIDYLIPPSSRQHFTGLENRLPSLDPKSGVLSGVHNPYMGPAIRFEPGATPFLVPGI